MTPEALQVLTLLNQFRASNGVGPLLAEDTRLDTSADGYARLLASQPDFQHYLNGTNPGGRAQAAGYPNTMVGENIARGFSTPQTVMVAWENSPGHRANMLLGAYTVVGIGVEEGPYGKSWVQDFGEIQVSPPGPGPNPGPVPVPVPVPAGSVYSLSIGGDGSYTWRVASRQAATAAAALDAAPIEEGELGEPVFPGESGPARPSDASDPSDPSDPSQR